MAIRAFGSERRAMMRTGLALAILGMMLAGCGGSTTSPGNSTVAATATPDPMEAKIAALSDAQRKTAFFRAIYDADYECAQIVKVETKPRDNNKPVWLVTCEDNGEYYITLQPGGIFTVSGIPQAKRRMPKGTTLLPAGTK
jgi:ABC-type glycerol-3-phosphate transport system substrate-binding protein